MALEIKRELNHYLINDLTNIVFEYGIEKIDKIVDGVRQTFTTVFGNMHGVLTKYFHDSVRISSITTYDFGQKSGLQINYYPSGLPLVYRTYKNGLLHGEYKDYDQPEIPSSTSTYHYNEIHGKCVCYTHSGNVILKYNYFHGQPHGKATSYCHKAGNIKQIFNYFHGYKFDIKPIVCDGSIQLLHHNGKLHVIQKYVNGKLSGEHKTYHYNGELNCVCNYRDGLLTGLSICYAPHTNSTITSDLFGKQTITYGLGHVWALEHYLNGELHGECKYYDKYNNLTAVENYQHGRLSGKCMYYNKGKLIRTQTKP